MRGPFLLLTPVCVALGLVCAWLTRSPIEPIGEWWIRAAMAMGAALCGHVSVNMLNEFVDARSGLDAMTERTPFSGGSGTLQARPEWLGLTLAGGVLSLAMAVCLGLALVWRAQAWWPLAPLGVLAVTLVLGYSPWIGRQPWLCLLAPGLGFGAVMVAGTSCAVQGQHTLAAWCASLTPLALVNNLLLLNQFPDVDADRACGRRNLPIAWGRPACVPVVWAQWGVAYAAIIAGVLLRQFPVGAALGLLTAPLAWRTGVAIRQHADDVPALVPHLGANVAITLLTPVLMGAGMLVG